MFGPIALVVLVIALVIVAPIVSLVWLSRLSERTKHLSQRVARLEQRLPASEQKAGQAETTPPTSVARTPIEEVVEAVIEQPEEALEEPEALTAAPKPPPEPATPPSAPPRAPEIASAGSNEPSVRIARQGPSWEERLAASWMVWLGGLTVALAAVFLFRYAVEQGWLTPLIRVILGLGLGGALLAGGEWALRAPAHESRGALPDYVPPALSASGIFAILASLYAAHAMYGFLGPATGFVALGLTAYSALVLSLRQGWFVAALGMLAGYLVPLMIESPASNAAATFIYLYVLTLGALALMIWRRWRWFTILAMLGAFSWPVVWTLGPWTMADQGTLGLYANALAASFAALSVRLPMARPKDPAWAWVAEVLADTSGFGFALSGVLLVYLAHVAEHNAAAFAFLVGYSVIALGMGLWRQSLEGLLPVAALVALAATLLWPEPRFISPPVPVQELGLEGVANAFGPWVMPPEFYAFSRTLWAFAGVFGLGGFLALWRVRSVPVWAGLSAFMPLLMFLIGYGRIGDFEIDIRWAWWATGLAVMMLLAAVTVHRSMMGDARNAPLGFYAAGVTGAIALAFACLFREAWLSVAMAAEVAALAWIWSILRVEALKAVAVAVLFAVVIRLVLNPMVLEYKGGFLGMFGWVVYGYGLPATASLFAARTFARDGRDLTVTLAEIAGIGFAFLMVALQLKLWTSGSIYTPTWDFLDMAVQAIWLMLAGTLMLSKPFLPGRPWAMPVGIALLSIAGILVFGGLLLTRNPLFSHEYIGSWPLVNLLTLGYLVPAGLFWLLASSDRFEVAPSFRRLFTIAAGVLVFADLTLEVRRAFWAPIIFLNWETNPSNAEIYAYSAVWTVFALALLALGIVWRSQGLRYASLAVLLATVAKVFLYDMSDLTGLFRVSSFLGLGLTLIGIGGVYRRFVFRHDGQADKP